MIDTWNSTYLGFSSGHDVPYSYLGWDLSTVPRDFGCSMERVFLFLLSLYSDHAVLIQYFDQTGPGP